MKKLVKEICAQEGKKHQASVADVREILKILAHLLLTNPALGEEWGQYMHKVMLSIAKKQQKASKKK